MLCQTKRVVAVRLSTENCYEKGTLTYPQFMYSQTTIESHNFTSLKATIKYKLHKHCSLSFQTLIPIAIRHTIVLFSGSRFSS